MEIAVCWQTAGCDDVDDQTDMVMMMRGAGGRREVQKVAKECDHQTHTSTFLTHRRRTLSALCVHK